MKYIVEVNAKWLVSFEAESALRAEHKVLELEGVWGALAFDKDMLKTDTFLGAVQGCEMVSLIELATMANEAMIAKAEASMRREANENAQARVRELEEMLKAAKEDALMASDNMGVAQAKYQATLSRLGQQR